jgi:hypothetical protein
MQLGAITRVEDTGSAAQKIPTRSKAKLGARGYILRWNTGVTKVLPVRVEPVGSRDTSPRIRRDSPWLDWGMRDTRLQDKFTGSPVLAVTDCFFLNGRDPFFVPNAGKLSGEPRRFAPFWFMRNEIRSGTTMHTVRHVQQRVFQRGCAATR